MILSNLRKTIREGKPRTLAAVERNRQGKRCSNKEAGIDSTETMYPYCQRSMFLSENHSQNLLASVHASSVDIQHSPSGLPTIKFHVY